MTDIHGSIVSQQTRFILNWAQSVLCWSVGLRNVPIFYVRPYCEFEIELGCLLAVFFSSALENNIELSNLMQLFGAVSICFEHSLV